ncbi:MAG: sensor histidine kinase [Cellulosilyticaceae bacterium]
MNRNYTLKQGIILWCIVIIVAGGILGITILKPLSQLYYDNMAQVVGKVSGQDPNLEKAMMMAVKTATHENHEKGLEVLKQYGYESNIFFKKNIVKGIGWGILIMLPVGLTAILILVSYDKKHKTRIDELTAYLYGTNQKKAPTLTKTFEDEYSFLEDEIYKTVVSLRQMEEEAVQEHQLLANNLSDIAHQIKTPITSMSIMAELLLETIQDEEGYICIQKIQIQLTRLDKLVTSLLTLSKLDAKALVLYTKEVDVFSLVVGATQMLEEITKARKQEVIIASQQVATYLGDFNWSMEALINLIKNCSEHTPLNGKIFITYEQNPLYTQIMIEDTGSGFDKEDLPYVFKRFYKGKNAEKDSVGIGLALAKAIIEKQNGTITAENNRQGGARFNVKFYKQSL